MLWLVHHITLNIFVKVKNECYKVCVAVMLLGAYICSVFVSCVGTGDGDQCGCLVLMFIEVLEG